MKTNPFYERDLWNYVMLAWYDKSYFFLVIFSEKDWKLVLVKKCSLIIWVRSKKGLWKKHENVLLPNKFYGLEKHKRIISSLLT